MSYQAALNFNFIIIEKVKKTNKIFLTELDILGQGCPTFFYNGPNYKFSYSRRAARKSSL